MQVLMETSAGNITIELFDKEAPDTVANFVKLVNMGHYNGLHFHRVIEFETKRKSSRAFCKTECLDLGEGCEWNDSNNENV